MMMKKMKIARTFLCPASIQVFGVFPVQDRIVLRPRKNSKWMIPCNPIMIVAKYVKTLWVST